MLSIGLFLMHLLGSKLALLGNMLPLCSSVKYRTKSSVFLCSLCSCTNATTSLRSQMKYC